MKTYFKKLIRLLTYSISLLFSTSPSLSLLFILLVVVQGLLPTVSVFIGIKLGNMVSACEVDYLFIVSILWVISFILPGVLAPISSTLQSILNQKATYLTQRKIILSAIKITDLKVLESQEVHDNFESLSREASNKPLNFLVTIVDLFKDFITLFSLSVLISSILWWLPFVLLLPAFPVALSVAKSQKDIFIAFSGMSKTSRLIKYYISTLLNSSTMKEIKVFRLSNFFLGKHSESFTQLEKELNKIRVTQIRRPQIWNLIYFITASIAMYYFSLSIISGKVTTGDLFGIIQAITYFALTCQWGVYSLATLSVCLEFFRKLYEVEKLSQSFSEVGTFDIPKDKTIRFENVSFEYHSDLPIIKDISCTINEGDRVALIGENGAGKTTFIKLLCKIYKPTTGRITVGGVDINDIKNEAWMQYLAVVFQDIGKYVLSIEDNIYLGEIENRGDKESLKRACEKADFNLPHGMNFTTLLGKEFDGTELSGGQWQRLAIARALYSQSSELVIFDEPTSALDPRIEAKVFENLENLSKGKTSIIITHRMWGVKNVSHIILLKNGEILEEGTPDKLLEKKGEYYNLIALQEELYLHGK